MAASVKINLDTLTANNLGIFNRITSPAVYPDTFLQQCKDSGELCQYAYFSEVPVGVVVAETVVNKSPIALKVTLLTVLDAYAWKYGIERKLLQYVVDLCPQRHLKTCVLALPADAADGPLAALARDMGFVADSTPDSDGVVLLRRSVS